MTSHGEGPHQTKAINLTTKKSSKSTYPGRRERAMAALKARSQTHPFLPYEVSRVTGYPETANEIKQDGANAIPKAHSSCLTSTMRTSGSQPHRPTDGRRPVPPQQQGLPLEGPSLQTGDQEIPNPKNALQRPHPQGMSTWISWTLLQGKTHAKATQERPV